MKTRQQTITMTIQYYTKKLYGSIRKYAHNEEAIQKLRRFMPSSRYISPNLEQGLKDLGHIFVEILTPKDKL